MSYLIEKKEDKITLLSEDSNDDVKLSFKLANELAKRIAEGYVPLIIPHSDGIDMMLPDGTYDHTLMYLDI